MATPRRWKTLALATAAAGALLACERTSTAPISPSRTSGFSVGSSVLDSATALAQRRGRRREVAQNLQIMGDFFWAARDGRRALDYYAGRGGIVMYIERQGQVYTTEFVIQ